MSKTYVVRNQVGQYSARKGEWISGRDAAAIAHFPHFDQAVNHLFELGLKEIHLRGKVCDVLLQENGKPLVEDFGPEPVSHEDLAAEAAV